MNIAGYALKNKQVIFFFLIITIFGGIFAFENLGKREDSPFVIKQIIFMTYYPGANANQVQKQVKSENLHQFIIVKHGEDAQPYRLHCE